MRDDGTREVSWVFEPHQIRLLRSRRRVLLFCGLGGSRDEWEIVYREQSCSGAIGRLAGRVEFFAFLGEVWGGPVLHYNSLSRRARTEDLAAITGEILDEGLVSRRRPVSNCGCAVTRRR